MPASTGRVAGIGSEGHVALNVSASVRGGGIEAVLLRRGAAELGDVGAAVGASPGLTSVQRGHSTQNPAYSHAGSRDNPRTERASLSVNHLRAVDNPPRPRDARQQEPETAVLSRVADALDAAIESPALSTGWRVAFRAAQRHLRDCG